MQDSKSIKATAKALQFLSTLYRDEIPLDLVSMMQKADFTEKLSGAAKESGAGIFEEAVSQITSFLNAGNKEKVYKELSYEYADLFLNAGANPVFPYESVHVSKEPVVMQAPVFELRKAFYKAGVHKSEDYKDLDEHIAVEIEFLRYLLDMEMTDKYTEFFKDRFLAWVPSFCEQLENCAQTDFYKGLAKLTRAVIECSMTTLSESAGDAEKAINSLAASVGELNLDSGYVTLTEGSVEPEPAKNIPSHCYTCGALCGMVANLKDGILVKTSGLPGDPKGGGRLCPKGASANKHLYSPYRLKSPMIKENGRFRKASWDEALDRVVQGIKSIEQGKLGYFRGNDYVNWIHEALFDHLGCPKGTHRTMCDNSNRMANEHNLNDKRPWINYQESDYIIHFGINELATSIGQRKTAEFREAIKNRAKLVVFDPRKSETASSATEWIQIKPSTDGAVAMAMCYVIIKNDLYDKEFVADWTYGFEEFKKRVLGEEDGVARTPEWAEKISGVPAKTIERIAVEFAGSKNKGVISWAGVAQGPNSMYATAAIQALNGLCGAFDAPGGPSLPFKRKLKSAWGEGQEKPPKTPAPKLDKFGLWSGWAPANMLADVEAGKLKGMITYFGDPVLSAGNQEAITKAIEMMGFNAIIEAYMCNTALLCDVILPDATWMEQAQIKPDWLYDAFIGYYAEVVKPMYNTKPIWKIIVELAGKLNLGHFFPWENIEEAFRNQMAGLPWSFDELKEKGFIITDEAEYYKYKKWGSLNPPEGYGSSGNTKTGKYNFLNPVAREKGIDPLPDYKEPDKEFQPDEEYPFIFGNFRVLGHEHSSTFNNYYLMKQYSTNPLWINMLDAQKLGITEGDRVKLKSPWGEVDMVANPTWRIMSGVLATAGGFGHIRGIEGDPKYPQFGGVNTPGIMKPNTTEEIGGTPLRKYIKTKVVKL
ncbi:MAG: molybdopterin-dependent oxidoreductase [Candidatus Desulfaltia sp.]|nr:molybdopterin-dependent oxidoreductase [Candidatus Desulfaltia sp.]